MRSAPPSRGRDRAAALCLGPGIGNRATAGSRGLDLFDRVQLRAVIDVCRRASSLSEAGRQLFAASRQEKANPNDADRLRKYLARFGLDWQQVKGQG
jgi:sigma54-dependent transcription regulator